MRSIILSPATLAGIIAVANINFAFASPHTYRHLESRADVDCLNPDVLPLSNSNQENVVRGCTNWKIRPNQQGQCVPGQVFQPAAPACLAFCETSVRKVLNQPIAFPNKACSSGQSETKCAFQMGTINQNIGVDISSGVALKDLYDAFNSGASWQWLESFTAVIATENGTPIPADTCGGTFNFTPFMVESCGTWTRAPSQGGNSRNSRTCVWERNLQSGANYCTKTAMVKDGKILGTVDTSNPACNVPGGAVLNPGGNQTAVGTVPQPGQVSTLKPEPGQFDSSFGGVAALLSTNPANNAPGPSRGQVGPPNPGSFGGESGTVSVNQTGQGQSQGQGQGQPAQVQAPAQAPNQVPSPSQPVAPIPGSFGGSAGQISGADAAKLAPEPGQFSGSFGGGAVLVPQASVKSSR